MSGRWVQMCLPGLTSSAEDFPVRTCQALARERALLVLEAASGLNSLASLRNAARDGSWLKTSGPAHESGSMPCDETWDGSVMRRYRSRFQQAMSEHPTSAHAFSSWLAVLPTLTAQSYGSNVGGSAGRVGKKRGSLRSTLPTLTVRWNHNRAGLSEKSGDGLATRVGSGPLNPTWLEGFMGFPLGWTDLDAASSEPME